VSSDLGVAISVAGWILTLETSLVVTGAVAPDSALARRTAARWWYVAPAVAAGSGAVSAAILPGWISRVFCGAAAIVACSVFVLARPRRRQTPGRARHGGEWSDGYSARRLVILTVAVVTYTVGVFVTFRTLG